MLRIFRQGTIGQIFIIMAAVVALWWWAFVSPVAPQPVDRFAPLYELAYPLLVRCPRLSSAIAMVLVAAQAVWVNLLLASRKLVGGGSLLPTLIYVVVMSWDHSMLTLTPMVMVNIFVIAALGQLLSKGMTTLSFERNFNAAFCIGLAALCYLPSLCLVVPLLLIFTLYKLYRWRDLVVFILGLVAPSIIMLLHAYMTDKLDYYLILIAYDLSDFAIRIESLDRLGIVRDGILLLMTLYAILQVLFTIDENVVHQRINIGVLVYMLLGSLLMTFYTSLLPFCWQCVAPFAVYHLVRLVTEERKRRWIGEALLWILVVTAII